MTEIDKAPGSVNPRESIQNWEHGTGISGLNPVSSAYITENISHWTLLGDIAESNSLIHLDNKPLSG